MSKEYDNTNRWSLFKNDRKERDTHPDYTGTLNVDGAEYYLNGWVKEGKTGKFFSGSIKPKNAPQRRMSFEDADAGRGRRNDALGLDEDIPF